MAIDQGHEVLYFGSYRGQEQNACYKAGILFRGFRSEPFYGLKTVKGWRSGWNLYAAGFAAKKALKKIDPDAVFSTGGYSSSPVISAAASLGIPYVILEQNSIPGRVNKKAGPEAHAVCTVFGATGASFLDSRVVRTGMPIRRELRAAASAGTSPTGLPLILVMGGSQGAAALNSAAMSTALQLRPRQARWLHLTGKTHFEEVARRASQEMGSVEYEVRPFMEAPEMAEALASASLAVCRSGAGTVTELAAFRLPSVLVPYPAAHGDHQHANALEIVALGGATIVPQASLSSELTGAVDGWLESPERRSKAGEALSAWDEPEAPAKIMSLLQEAAEVGL
nr:Glycosyltransferase family 28 C-terminal domain protein [uncultured bacterium]